jgi:uncharacterized protein
MDQTRRDSGLIAAILAVGIILGGWLAGRGFVAARTAERFVTVKGVAERIVDADLGLWPLRFVVTDDDLGQAQSRIESQRRLVLGFLARHGLDSSTTEIQSLDVTDVQANPYSPQRSGASRFIVSMGLMVRSESPTALQSASQAVGELLNAGVVLSSEGRFISGPTFLFRKLNEMKPEMIAEATANARKGAEQFAKDSRTALGGIRRANQGVFEILPRDQAPGVMEGQQLQKTLRVVATVDYWLR